MARIPKSVQGIESEDTLKCPECGSKDIEKKFGEIYCKKCGYVLD